MIETTDANRADSSSSGCESRFCCNGSYRRAPYVVSRTRCQRAMPMRQAKSHSSERPDDCALGPAEGLLDLFFGHRPLRIVRKSRLVIVGMRQHMHDFVK